MISLPDTYGMNKLARNAAARAAALAANVALAKIPVDSPFPYAKPRFDPIFFQIDRSDMPKDG